jgi:RNA polymerase sigma factor (sigma-70 family)
MLDETTFTAFIKRIRSGDDQATAELVGRYEPEIRREARLRLRDPRLRRDVDSMDICQSVLASFFVRAAAGQYELDRPEQLLRLLMTMVRNKVVYQVRRQRRQRRDNRRLDEPWQEKLDTIASGASPTEVVAEREILQMVRERLNAEECEIADLRGLGREWTEVAAHMGGTAEGRRKQLTRAIKRVVEELGLDDVSD